MISQREAGGHLGKSPVLLTQPSLQHGKVSSNRPTAGKGVAVWAYVFWRGRSTAPGGLRSMPRAQAPSSSMSSTRVGHVVHATTEAAAGRGAGSHPNLFVFATQRWRRRVSEGEDLPALSFWRGVLQPHRCVAGLLAARADGLFSTSAAALQGMGFAIVLGGSWAPLKTHLFQAELASTTGRLTVELRHVGVWVFF